jgi:hypothetical protein
MLEGREIPRGVDQFSSFLSLWAKFSEKPKESRVQLFIK